MDKRENAYFNCRKLASAYNEKLSSREGAAEQLGISVSTLADYELGITKVVPVDKVVLMADLYNAPELKTGYCKNECPIGGFFQLPEEVKGIQGIALRLLQEFDENEINGMKKELINISADGIIDDNEKETLADILSKLDILVETIGELKLIGEKRLGEK